MTPRLIPWCLAATGFLAVLSIFGLQGELGGPGQRLAPPVAAGFRIAPPAVGHHDFQSSQRPAPSEEPEDMPQTLILPLPPATQPEPDLNLESVVDDTPTVEDLPARQSEAELSENE
jgi:hypothetical protein